ncbi:MAG TPA: DUF2304 domain-containing protein [bacterium]|nr:DUF2304 domain-containing protein [bacterium]HOL47650.1 DUF2304 domain-containing protein [bacterium]HPQ18408.1 DUF2304 domain-containing protein [bacterium]
MNYLIPDEIKLFFLLTSIIIIFFSIKNIKKGLLHIKHSIVWLLLSIINLIYISLPQNIFEYLKIKEPIYILFLIVIVFLLMINFIMNLNISILEKKNKKLTQELALLKFEKEKDKNKR